MGKRIGISTLNSLTTICTKAEEREQIPYPTSSETAEHI